MKRPYIFSHQQELYILKRMMTFKFIQMKIKNENHLKLNKFVYFYS